MKAPWFPFYTGDFLASAAVQDMEAHEVGAYVLLLARSWQSDTPGYLEDDDYTLRRAARLSVEQWAQSKNALLKKWPVAEDKPGYRFNPRLLKEADKQVELREKKAEAGRRSAAKREAAAAAGSTQGQQTGNTNPTGVENQATGVEQNTNYSQPQSQSQAKAGMNEGAGSQPVSASPSKSPTKHEATHQGGGAPLWPDEAKVFTIARFAEYTAGIGFGTIDRGRYLPQIQVRAEELKEQRNETGWERFIRDYLNLELRKGRLMEAATAPGPTTYRNPNNPPAPTPKTTGYSLPDKIRAQSTKIYI